MDIAIVLAVLLSMTGSSGDHPPSDQQPAPAEQPAPVVQHGPEVSGSRSSTSPPLRDIPPAVHKPGKLVHPWRHIPRPHSGSGTTTPQTPRVVQKPSAPRPARSSRKPGKDK